jgi:uncharacterized protein
MTVFPDTFALIAWLNSRDSAHAMVAEFLEGYIGKLLITEWVLLELADALSSPHARSTVVEFIQAIRSDGLIDVVGYDHSVYQRGSDLFVNRPDKSWSLTDCISFEVMTEADVKDALTADHHFEQAGFRAVFK